MRLKVKRMCVYLIIREEIPLVHCSIDSYFTLAYFLRAWLAKHQSATRYEETMPLYEEFFVYNHVPIFGNMAQALMGRIPRSDTY